MKSKKTITKPSKTEIKQAEAVLARQNAYESEVKRRAQEKYVGKFYRYRNRYSADESWWLYAAVTGVEGPHYPRLKGWTIEKTTQNTIEIRLDYHCDIFRNEEELTKEQFWKAVDGILQDTTATLDALR